MKKMYFLSLGLLLGNLTFAQNAPVDFEAGGFGAAWTWTCFENSSNPPLEIIANPDPSGLNTSATVAKFTALQAGNPWAGCETQHGADIGSFTITASNSMVRIMVWKSKISNVGIKLVTSSGASLGEILVANTQINKWEQLTFDFSAHIGGMTYDQLVIFPDFIARPADDIIYFDNVFGGAATLNTEELQANATIAYPNPTNGILYLDSNAPVEKIKVFQLDGKMILDLENVSKLDLSEFEDGTYLLQKTENGVISTQRIQKI